MYTNICMEKDTPKLITAVNAIQFPVAQFLIRIYLTEASVTLLSDLRPKFRCYHSSCVSLHTVRPVGHG